MLYIWFILGWEGSVLKNGCLQSFSGTFLTNEVLGVGGWKYRPWTWKHLDNLIYFSHILVRQIPKWLLLQRWWWFLRVWGLWVCMCVCGMLQCALDFLYLGLVVCGLHRGQVPIPIPLLFLYLSLSFTHTPTHMPPQHTQTIRNLGCLL